MGEESLFDLNKKWFELHKHLSNSEMLEKGLIDSCDLNWVNLLRKSGEKNYEN